MEPTSTTSTILCTINPPPLWKVDSQGQTEDSNAIETALSFLKKHPEWIQKNLDRSTSYFSLLETTKLTYISNSAWKAYKMLFVKYPHLFPLQQQNANAITLKTNNPEKKIIVPKNRLFMLSEKFKAALNSNTREGLSNEIELKTDRYKQKYVQVFLKFMESGELTLTGNNVLQLL